MKTLTNDKGIALVTALLLTVLSLSIIIALLYVISAQTTMSGAHKRYKNSLEASHGAVRILTREVIPMMFSASDPRTSLTNEFASIQFDMVSNDCFKQKMVLPSSEWSSCGESSRTLDPKQGPDATFKLRGAGGPGFKVFAKIVETTPGNTNVSGLDLDNGIGVTGITPGISPKHLPYLYRIETEGESALNPREKANLTVVYSY